MGLLELLCRGSLCPAPAVGASGETWACGLQRRLPWTLLECLRAKWDVRIHLCLLSPALVPVPPVLSSPSPPRIRLGVRHRCTQGTRATMFGLPLAPGNQIT